MNEPTKSKKIKEETEAKIFEAGKNDNKWLA